MKGNESPITDAPVEERENVTNTANELVNTKMFDQFGEPAEVREKELKIYDDYAHAMRMRKREPLEEARFVHHFFKGGNQEDPVMFGCERNGFLLGSNIDDVFVPTHFAPANLRGGYRLIKGLLEEEIPTALFITQDLVDTIKKMDGWMVLPFKLKADFRGTEVEKTLVVNNWGSLFKLGKHELSKKIKEEATAIGTKLRDTAEAINRFGSKVMEKFKGTDANAQEIDMDEALLRKWRASLEVDDSDDLFD